MTAEPPESPVTEVVRSLEVRWIFPGQLEAAVAGWFGRFPAATESREDTYLIDPRLPGLSVKVRGGGALEVKVYRGSPGILEVAGRARGRLQSWQKWSFPFSPPRQDSGDPAGWRPVRKRRRISRFSGVRGPVVAPAPGPGLEPRCEVDSPRSAPVVRIGGPWASRRPAPAICSAAHWRPPPRWCSPRPCPVVWNPARMNPGPTRSGWADGRAPTGTLSREDSSLPGRVLDDVHTVTTDDAMRRDMGYSARASGRRDDPQARRVADGRRGRQRPGELSPAVASLSVSVITVTVLLSVIAHGASAEPLAWRYGAAAGPGGTGIMGYPGPSCPPICRSRRSPRRCSCPAPRSSRRRFRSIAELGASSRSQAVARSRELGLLKGPGPASPAARNPSRPRFPPASRGGLTSNPMGWSADSVGGQRAQQAEAGGIVAGAVPTADRLARRGPALTLRRGVPHKIGREVEPSTHVSFVTVRYSRPGRRGSWMGGWPSGGLPAAGLRAAARHGGSGATGATADRGCCGQHKSNTSPGLGRRSTRKQHGQNGIPRHTSVRVVSWAHSRHRAILISGNAGEQG